MKKIILFLFCLFPTILLGKNELSKDNSQENLVSYFNNKITEFKKETENDALFKNIDFIVENDFVTLTFEVIDNNNVFAKITDADVSELKQIFLSEIEFMNLLYNNKKGMKLLLKSDIQKKCFIILTYEEIKDLLTK